MGRIRVGISGWRYPGWRGSFYPPGLVQRRELAFAAERLSSIEVNGSFYSLQRPTSYAAWRDETPEDFVFAVKGGRFITHLKKLAGVESALANFFAQLPRTQGEAAALAAHHDDRLDDQRVLTSPLPGLADTPVRHALEVRHSSFATPALTDLLRHHDIAVVVADTAGKWPLIEQVTADFAYVRLHGAEELYASGYTPAALDRLNRAGSRS